jgi:ferredoxin
MHEVGSLWRRRFLHDWMFKKYIIWFTGIFLLPGLQACSSAIDTKDDTTDEIVVGEAYGEETLTVNKHKCVGCGRCARVAPKNFAMDSETRKAVVVSPEISDMTKRAIEICPVVAISGNEK